MKESNQYRSPLGRARQELRLPGLLFAILALGFLVSALLEESPIRKLEPSFTSSAELSIGLTLAAIAIAITIYNRQASEASNQELRNSDRLSYLEENITSAVNSARKAFEERLGAPPSEEDTDHLEESIRSWSLRPGAGVRQVLWIDDNPSSIKWERNTLEQAGISVIWASNTNSALDLLNGNKFNLIITDMKRPEGNMAGLNFLNRLRKVDVPEIRETPVIVYSGSATEDQRKGARAHGAIDQSNNPYRLLLLALENLGACD